MAVLFEGSRQNLQGEPGEWFSPRTAERLRGEIRQHFGYREATVADGHTLTQWACAHCASVAEGEIAAVLAVLEARCRKLAIEAPTPDRMERIARAAMHLYEERFTRETFERLSLHTKECLNALLLPDPEAEEAPEGEDSGRNAPALLQKLRLHPGRPGLASVQEELARLSLIRHIALPPDLFANRSPRQLERYRRRVAVEAPHELRRHPEEARLTWLAAFVHLREGSLTDKLVDLLIETIHQIGARAERRVERELLADFKRVTGKHNLLFELAAASLNNPEGRVRDVVFPVVGERTLRELVKEWKATGPSYRVTLRTVIRNSYQGH